MKRLYLVPFFCFFLLVSVARTGHCQSAEEVIDEFFSYYLAGDPAKALEFFFLHNPEFEDNEVTLNLLKRKLESVVSVNGECYGYDTILTRHDGESRIVSFVLVKHERKPILFKLVLYKPREDWYGYSAEFDIDFEKIQTLRITGQ